MPTILFGINKVTSKPVHIDEATKWDKYVCVICKQPLIIREGDVTVKHFAHFYPIEECPLRTKELYGGFSFDSSNTYPSDGINQSFEEWMEYVHAIKNGEKERAATLWDFDFSTVTEEVNEEPLQQTVHHETFVIPNDEEFLGTMEMEWTKRKTMLKPIIQDHIQRCPISKLKTSIKSIRTVIISEKFVTLQLIKSLC
jgi:hypothetical protein